MSAFYPEVIGQPLTVPFLKSAIGEKSSFSKLPVLESKFIKKVYFENHAFCLVSWPNE